MPTSSADQSCGWVSPNTAGWLIRRNSTKLYYLAEHAPDLTWHDLGGMGFTWYGGVITGSVAVLIIIRRRGLPLGLVSGLLAVPLSLAYGIGRLGCLLAGDGTYGRPTDLPWGMAFPHGTVPTLVPVHPTPLYEALAAFAIAIALFGAERRTTPPVVFGLYLVLSGTARFLVPRESPTTSRATPATTPGRHSDCGGETRKLGPGRLPTTPAPC